MIRKVAAAVAINAGLIGVLVVTPIVQGHHSPTHNPPGHADGRFGYGYLPGWGYGDPNHEHSGPPGLNKQTSLPPGLANKDDLPPGLAKKDQLPPGSAKKQ